MKVEIFSDVACPCCYIGHARFARAAEAFRAKGGRLEVEMRPFQLNPAATSDGEPLLTHLERKFGANAAQMSARVEAAIDEVAERTGQTPIVVLADSADGCEDGYCAV